MNSVKDEKIKLGTTIFFSALALGVYYAITFLLTPYITANLGTDAYGFVSLAKNFATYAGILTIAMNSYATRFISVSYHRNEHDKCRIYFSSVLYADIILAIVIFGISLIFIWKLEYLLHIPSELISQVKLLFLFTAVGFSLTTIGTVFSASAYIKNQLDKTNIFKAFSYVMEALALLLLFRNFPIKVWYVGAGSIVSTVVIVAFDYLLYHCYTPEIRFSQKYFSLKAVRQLVVKGIWNSLNSLGNTLNSGLDLIITNLMLNSLTMGQLAIAKTISTIFYALFQMIAQPFQPIFLDDYSRNDKKKLCEDLITSIKVSGLFSNLAFAGFFSLGLVYYKLWIPNEDIKFVWMLTVVTIFGSIIEGAVFPLFYIYTLTVHNKIPCLITIGGGVLNVIGMYLLIRFTNLGVYAVVLMTAVIMTCINLGFNPLYMAHCLHIKCTFFYLPLARHLVSCIVLTVACTGIVKLFHPSSWLSLILVALLLCAVGTMLHIAIMGIEPNIYKKIIKDRAQQ